MEIKDYVLEQKDYVIGMRRYFHAHPELSLHEFNTCRRIEEELNQMNIPHRRVGETGVFAWIDGEKGPGRTIVLRADMDALPMDDLKDVPYRSQNPGCCHSCGHDSHTATLLGAARILKAKSSEFSGQIRLFFQQAEEIGQGARQFVKAGLMEGADRVFGVHVNSSLESGKIALTKGPQNASCDYFKITVTGQSAHVSKPHLGIDAVNIASQIVVNLQSIVARCTDPLDTVVVGIGVVRAGTQYNIVADHAEIEGTTRCFSQETRAATNERIKIIAEGIAASYGGSAKVEFQNFANPLINDPQAVAEVTSVLEPICGKEAIVSDYEKGLTADDFADYLAEVKGMYAFLGTRIPENPDTAQALHNGHFDIDENALLLSCNAYVDYALWVLGQK